MSASNQSSVFHLREADFERISLGEQAGLGTIGFTITPTRFMNHHIRMTIGDFASVIAAMTPKGDNAETFAAAERFLLTGEFERAD